MAVQEQPARALRDVAPNQQDREAHDRSQAEREAPPDVESEDGRVEQEQRGNEPRIVPIQNEPPMMRSTAPRTRAGISSSTAEWIAEYSPPLLGIPSRAERRKPGGRRRSITLDT
jgi:hypothetical protein